MHLATNVLNENIEGEKRGEVIMFSFKEKSKKDSTIKRLEFENRQLEAHIKILTDKLDKILLDLNTAPEGCKPGPYCKACEFSKSYSYSYSYHNDIVDYPYLGHHNIIYTCGKAETCKNFVEMKKENKDD